MRSRLFRLDFDRAHFGDRGLGSSTVGCAADTVFSALCVEALQAGGQGLLDGLVAAVTGGTLRFTDALPYVGDRYLVPKPLAQVRSGEASSRVAKKLAKKVQHIPVDQVPGFLAGRADLGGLVALQARLGVHAVSAQAAIHNGQKDAEPYRVGYFRFAGDAGLWLLAEGSDTELDLLARLLGGVTALGGERSSGYGAFTLSEVPVPRAFAARGGSRWMTLATALPADSELDAALDGATYRLVKRSGFVASRTFAGTPRRKRDVYKLAAGSVFTRTFTGVVEDVGVGGAHPVYSYAKPLFLTLPEVAA